MTHKIIFLRQAELDLIELKKYILEHFSYKIWQISYNNIKKTIHSIALFPERGSIPSEMTKLNLNRYRQAISGKNRIIYEIGSQIIYIHIICDTRKDMMSLLVKRLLTDNSQ